MKNDLQYSDRVNALASVSRSLCPGSNAIPQLKKPFCPNAWTSLWEIRLRKVDSLHVNNNGNPRVCLRPVKQILSFCKVKSIMPTIDITLYFTTNSCSLNGRGNRLSAHLHIDFRPSRWVISSSPSLFNSWRFALDRQETAKCEAKTINHLSGLT